MSQEESKAPKDGVDDGRDRRRARGLIEKDVELNLVDRLDTMLEADQDETIIVHLTDLQTLAAVGRRRIRGHWQQPRGGPRAAWLTRRGR